jgi:hypothetical protein
MKVYILTTAYPGRSRKDSNYEALFKAGIRYR